MEITSGKYRELGLVVAGTLAVIFVSTIVTETFLANDVSKQREDNFGCLVNHLEQQNINDETFGVADSLDISSVNCVEIVTKRNTSLYEDLEQRMRCLIEPYNISCGQCNELRSPIFSEMEHSNKSLIATCPEKEKESSREKKSVTLAVISNPNCQKLKTCIECFIEKISATDYQQTILHSAAVKDTIIDFKIWKYFSISPRVKELNEQSAAFEKSSIDQCVNEKKCEKLANICKD